MKQDVAGRFDPAELTNRLPGGFAPVVPLLREFHYHKAAVVLDGLPYSAWSLLEHMRHRQAVVLDFLRDPGRGADLWPPAYWPADPDPGSESAWHGAIAGFEQDLRAIIVHLERPVAPLFGRQPNGCTPFGAAIDVMQHNAYHIGQVKAIGRQLGVW